MTDLASKRPLGADDVDLVHSVHRSRDLANADHLGHPYAEHAHRETENSPNEVTPKAAQAIREDMRIDKSLGAAAMALATLSSGIGTVRAARDGQLVPALRPGKDGDTKVSLLSGATSAVEGQSHSIKLAPGERIQSLSHLLEDRLSLAAPYTTAPLVESGRLRLKNVNQPSMQMSGLPDAPTGQEGSTISHVKNERRDHSLHDRGLILKTQIPKKGRPISRHTPSSRSNAKSTPTVSLSGCLQPTSTCITGRDAESWTSSFEMQRHQLPLQSPGGHGMPGGAGQQFTLKSERVSSRPDWAQMSTSVAPHTHSQLYSGQQSGSFSTLTPKQIHDSTEGSRFTSGISFRSIGPETSPKSATTSAASQFPKGWHGLPQACSSDHNQHTNYASLIHDRSGEVAPFPARKYQEAESAFAAGVPISMNSRKRNSAGVEKRQDRTFNSESGIRPQMPSVYDDLEKRGEGEGMDPYELREESRRASKRTSRSDLDFTSSSERPSESKAGSHQRRPRSMVLPHGHNDPALQVRRGLESAIPLHCRTAYEDDEKFVAHEIYSVSTSRFLHSHTRSLDTTWAESSRTSHRPQPMNYPVRPTSSGVGSYLTQRPPHPIFPPATAHPGRPNPSVSLVPKVPAVPAAVPSMPTDYISPSVPSLPAVSAVAGDSLLRCTDHHSHASASSHSLSSSYYPSPTVSNSPRFEPSTDPIPVKTDATFFLSTTALNVLSPSNGSPVSASSQAGGGHALPVVQSHQDYVLDHKGPAEVTLRADRLAREMSGSSYPTLRGRRATSFGAMGTASKSTVRKTQGTYLKKHQILQQQLQQLQREQEMDLFRGVRQQRPYQHHEHYPHRSLQQSRRQKEQAPRHPQEIPSALRDSQECYPPEQLLQQQQPRPGRPPKQRVLMRSQSSSVMVFEHSSSASFQPAQIQPSEVQQSRMHHAFETHQPQRRQNQNQRQQQQQHQQQQPRILLRPVSLPLLAMGSTDPTSPLFLSQPPLSQPRFQSMHVPDLSESMDLPRAYTRGDSTCMSSLDNRFHAQPTVRAASPTAVGSVGEKSVPSHQDNEVIERLSIRPPVSAP